MAEILPESKKLKGLVITIAALCFVLLLSLVAIAFFGDSIQNLFIAIGAQITSLGGLHQGSQMMADRSPNYNPPSYGVTSTNPTVPPATTGNGMRI